MLSVAEPLGPAFAHAKRVCFEPFSMDKWFSLGFSAFLASLGQGGGGGGWQWANRFNGQPDLPRQVIQDAGVWVRDHQTFLVALGVAALCVALVFSALLVWLSSRGAFMFLDGVVHNRDLVRDPWDRFRELGNSLAVFRFCLGWGFFLLVAAVAFIGWIVVKPDIHAVDFGIRSFGTCCVGGCLVLLLALLVGGVSLLILDFVVPVMYLRNLRALDAFDLLWNEAVRDNLGSFLLYALLKIALSIGAGMIALLAGCLTCCLGFLPYLSSVVLLPVLVFFRAYALYFMEQLGPQWRIFPAPTPVEDVPVPEN